MDCSPPCSSVHGISWARILEWVAISISRGSSWPKEWTQISCIVLEKILEGPLTARRSNQSLLKEISPDTHWKDWCWSWSSNILATWCEADSLEKTLMLGKIEGRRRRGWQRMEWLDGIANSIGTSLSKLRGLVKNRESWCAAVYGVVKSYTVLKQLNK